jgi:hypothetical protein
MEAGCDSFLYDCTRKQLSLFRNLPMPCPCRNPSGLAGKQDHSELLEDKSHEEESENENDAEEGDTRKQTRKTSLEE